MHKVFISYHHVNDQYYKEELLRINDKNDIFIDQSVDTGDVSDDLSDEAIREKIRDEYLQDSTVTILLVGLETKKRKHVDWEIYSSMFDGKINKKSGILVVGLPSENNPSWPCHTSHEGEKVTVYPEITNWCSITTAAGYEERYPYAPDRIIDNLLKPEAKVSIMPWHKIESDPANLAFLIEATYADRQKCEYDMSRQMRRANS